MSWSRSLYSGPIEISGGPDGMHFHAFFDNQKLASPLGIKCSPRPVAIVIATDKVAQQIQDGIEAMDSVHAYSTQVSYAAQKHQSLQAEIAILRKERDTARLERNDLKKKVVEQEECITSALCKDNERLRRENRDLITTVRRLAENETMFMIAMAQVREVATKALGERLTAPDEFQVSMENLKGPRPLV